MEGDERWQMRGVGVCEGESTGTLVLNHIWVRGRKVLEPSSCGLFNHVLQWMRMECWRRDKLFNGDVEVVWVEYIIYFIDCFEPYVVHLDRIRNIALYV